MTPELEVLLAQLPAPFTGVLPGAWIEHGKRKLSWTLPGPGELYRNRYWIAWVDVAEDRPFSAEPSCWPTRRREESYSREGWTDAGRKALSQLILPPVARIGFDRLWTLCLAERNAGTDYSGQAARYRALAAWWDAKTELSALHALGLVTYRPGGPTDHLHRAETVLVGCDHGHGSLERVPVAAYAYVDGEHVGWLTQGADLVPISTGLDAHR